MKTYFQLDMTSVTIVSKDMYQSGKYM